MRPRNELWQGCSGYWQNYFIEQNLLLLGYAAWNGYLNRGRGILICEVTDVIPAAIDWQVERVGFSQQFVPQGQIASYLQETELEQAVIQRLVQTIATYDFNREMVILIRSSGTIDINLLQPKIAPLSCYEQVKHRWAEFQSDFLLPPGRSCV
ncbi:hypothetical protein [Chroococcidiopsis sp. TS-821]|uniref:hypothetical protein n=1 Tax=Chroococcidiopsis sp. TS-821 TaxID=1378066 RepID=UPI000CEE3026|nr:hypothetical protein [Chroococcidiopsis sp. TS-821]PPS40401.1 hypothetical protein B1A85_20290 [Chroococcidiopsis sp. TS-821]